MFVLRTLFGVRAFKLGNYLKTCSVGYYIVTKSTGCVCKRKAVLGRKDSSVGQCKIVILSNRNILYSSC